MLGINRRLATLETKARGNSAKVLVCPRGADQASWRRDVLAPIIEAGGRPLVVMIRDIGAEVQLQSDRSF